MSNHKSNSAYMKRVFGGSIFSGDQLPFYRLLATCALAAKALPHFDAIAFRGHSGCAVGFPLGAMLDCPMLLVRKAGAQGHFRQIVEGSVNSDVHSYLIVDDFIESGDTIRTIKAEIMRAFSDQAYRPPRCTGAIYYNPSYDTPSGHRAALPGVPWAEIELPTDEAYTYEIHQPDARVEEPLDPIAF